MRLLWHDVQYKGRPHRAAVIWLHDKKTGAMTFRSLTLYTALPIARRITRVRAEDMAAVIDQLIPPPSA